MVRANKQAAAKQANRSSKARYTSTASKPKTSNDGNTNSYNSTYAPLPEVIKRETKTMGEVTRKIGADGKKFFQKLGKGISDSFKSDTTTSK